MNAESTASFGGGGGEADARSSAVSSGSGGAVSSAVATAGSGGDSSTQDGEGGAGGGATATSVATTAGTGAATSSASASAAQAAGQTSGRLAGMQPRVAWQEPMAQGRQPHRRTRQEAAVEPAARSILTLAATAAQPPLKVRQKAEWVARHHPRARLGARAVWPDEPSISPAAGVASRALQARRFPVAPTRGRPQARSVAEEEGGLCFLWRRQRRLRGRCQREQYCDV
jgi:hypothetical protein